MMKTPATAYNPPLSPIPPVITTHFVALALALSMGAALSLGITRFAYGLLLSPMRADLGWSYTLAGAMNTVNALGYLLGALLTPRLLTRFGASRVLLTGALMASVFMGMSGFFTGAAPLLVQRLLAGFASALVFVAGGLMAARLGALQPARSGFLIGLYYGGTGFGIVLSALLVPVVLNATSTSPHGWAWAWWALALASFAVTALLLWPARVLANLTPIAAASGAPVVPFTWKPFGFSLAGYTMFGMGYIGYMTFVIALLREQGASGPAITVFYALLGLAVLLSPRIWAGLLDNYKGGQVLALLNALLEPENLIGPRQAARTINLIRRNSQQGKAGHQQHQRPQRAPEPAHRNSRWNGCQQDAFFIHIHERVVAGECVERTGCHDHRKHPVERIAAGKVALVQTQCRSIRCVAVRA